MKLSDEEKYVQHTVFSAACDCFEDRRRIHIEKHEREEQLEKNISAMPERLQSRAREALAAHRSQPGYTYEIYQEDHDEEEYFEEWDANSGGRALATNTWRGLDNSLNSTNLPPQQRLPSFRQQVAALEQRDPPQVKPRRLRLAEAKLIKEVERDEKMKREAAIKKSMAQSGK